MGSGPPLSQFIMHGRSLSTQGAADIDVTEGLGRGTPAEGAQGPREKGRKLTAGAQPVGVSVDLGDRKF